MIGLSHLGRVLVIAPHPDDEILGCGGTMARLAAEGAKVTVAVVTTGRPPAYSDEYVANVRREMREAHKIIGIDDVRMMDLPAAALDTVPAAKVNAAFQDLLDDVRPDTLFLPFSGDIHTDHQLSFVGAMVAARPRHREAPRLIMCYETLSETNWFGAPITPPFVPNSFIDISSTLERKLTAFACFASQVRAFPDERSLKAIEALANVRGAHVHLTAAEAFMMVRSICR